MGNVERPLDRLGLPPAMKERQGFSVAETLILHFLLELDYVTV